MIKAKRVQKGFTLLEILLVIAAIGILAAIILVAINPNRQLAQVRNAERRSEINTIYKALEQYLIDKGSYPTGITTSIQDICINGNTTNCVNLGVLVPDYIAAIPIDPGGGAYRVVINTSNNRVSVYASNAELGQGIGVNDRPWTPANISTALWLDAADASTITLNGGNVSQWNDKSGNARNATQATAANQPAYTASGLNGKPVLTWDGGNDVLNTASALNHPVSIYSVAQLSGATNSTRGIVGSGSQSYSLGTLSSSPAATSAYALWNPFLNGGAYINNTATTDPVVLGSTTVSNVENTWNTYVNGSNAGQAIWDTGTPAAPGFIRIGYSGVGSEYWLGTIAEVVITSTTLSTTDRQKLEGYLAWKWGLTNNLPANHPYKWNGTEFGGVNITDTDAQTYIAAVETADGQSLENNTRLAIQNFITGAKTDGIWDAIKSSNILAGARTLTGALVPLKGTAPTNFNFVSGDYNRKTGLVGNGSTKYLDSNRNNNADPQNSFHVSAQISSAHSLLTNSTYIGAGSGVSGVTHLGVARSGFVDTLFFRNRSAADIQNGNPTTAGFIGMSRPNSISINYRFNSTTATGALTSETPFNGNLLIFGRVVGQPYIAGRIAFYSIGESLNLALLDARVTQLMTDLGNAIP